MAAMTTATLSPAAAHAVDPLDFSLADRLPARPAGQGRLLTSAAPNGRPGLLLVPGAYHGCLLYTSRCV